MKYFVISADNNWGYSVNSLYEAIQKAAVEFTNKQQYFSEFVECAFQDESPERIKDYLVHAARDFKHQADDDREDVKGLEIVAITVSDDWKLDHADPMSGNPVWVPEEEGSEPEFKEVFIKLTAFRDGTLKAR